MELTHAIRKRRSVRNYLPKEVNDQTITELLELANLAPSACNKQNRHFIVVKDKNIIKNLYLASLKQSHVAKAPVIIAICLNKTIWKPQEFIKDSKEWGTDFWGATTTNYSNNQKFKTNWKRWSILWPIQDCDTAITTLILAAIEKGLSSCWIGLFDADATRKILKIPKKIEVVSLVTLGYSNNPPRYPGRKPIKNLLHWNRW